MEKWIEELVMGLASPYLLSDYCGDAVHAGQRRGLARR